MWSIFFGSFFFSLAVLHHMPMQKKIGFIYLYLVICMWLAYTALHKSKIIQNLLKNDSGTKNQQQLKKKNKYQINKILCKSTKTAGHINLWKGNKKKKRISQEWCERTFSQCCYIHTHSRTKFALYFPFVISVRFVLRMQRYVRRLSNGINNVWSNGLLLFLFVFWDQYVHRMWSSNSFQ